MDQYLERLCDELDASVFSGDGLHNLDAAKEFRKYLERWGRELDSIDKANKDQDR